MKISSILDLVDGRLLNQPSISFIYSIKTDPLKVKEGDLFLAYSINDIELAVNNGAFAIILENTFPMIDKEIAWIKVDDINLALKQLLRFKLANIDLKAFYCDEVTKELLNIYSGNLNKNIFFLENNLNDFVKFIDDLQDDDLLISTNQNLLDNIFPNNENFNKNNYKVDFLIKHSLFECSFSYEDIYFQKLKISPLYINQLLDVYNYFKKEIDLTKLKSFNFFKAIFLDKNNNVIEFGKSDKFIITQNYKSLYENEFKYLEENFTYGKKKYISISYETKISKEQTILNGLNEIKEYLINNRNFNAIYLCGFSYNEVYNFFEKKESQGSLF